MYIAVLSLAWPRSPPCSQFKSAPVETKASGGHTPGKGTATATATSLNVNNDDDDDEDADFEAVFAAELAKEMEKMLGQVKQQQHTGSSSTSGPPLNSSTQNDTEDTDEDRAFMDMFEKIMQAGENGTGGGAAGGEPDLEQLAKLMSGLTGTFPAAALGSSPSTAPAASTSKSVPSPNISSSTGAPNFQDSIRATMSKLAESEAQHKSRSGKTANGGSSDDPLAALMAQMEALGGGGGTGADGEEDLPELLDGLMDQLMSKELLAEPIAELKVKYPEYLSSEEARSLPREEKDRYQRQSAIIQQISDIFDDPTYKDSDKQTRERIAALMQEMQEAGQPPKHLLGELGPAMGPLAGREGGEEGCTIA